jgi:hypothetical protein
VVESKSNTTTSVSGLKIEEIKRLGKIAAGNMVVTTYAQIKEKLGIDVNYFTPVAEFAKINKTLRKLSQNGLNYAAIRHDNALVDVAYIDFKKMKRALR